MDVFLVPITKKMASIQIHIFHKVKKHWVFVSLKIKGMKMLK